ncbi:MAG TPA: hypothetical protein DCY93_02095 [Firmicutes bacterium]|nr:hypothetical protein [Bacillota bacterium]
MKKSLLLALMPLIVTTSCSNPISSISYSLVYFETPPSPPLSLFNSFIMPTELEKLYSLSNIKIEVNLAFYKKGQSDFPCPEYAMVYMNKGERNYSADNSVVLFETSNKEELEKFYFIPNENYTNIKYGGKVELSVPSDYFTEDVGIQGIYYTFKNPKENSDEEISPEGCTSIVYQKVTKDKIHISVRGCR